MVEGAKWEEEGEKERKRVLEAKKESGRGREREW